MRFLLIAFLSLLLCPGWAQDGGNPPVPGGALVPLDSETHVLRSGDTVEVYINALPDLPKDYEIRVDGRFHHPLAGEVLAAGRKISDLRADLKQRLGKELRNPKFRVGIVAVAQHQVAVLGEVQKQGTFRVGIGASVLDVIAAAGGLGPKADKERAVILRGTEEIEVSLKPGAKEGLTRVTSGDVLYILAGSPVSVTGQVTEPGVYSVSRVNGTPRQALLSAGGAKEEASLARVRLIRATEPKPIILDLRANPESPLPEQARQLEEGDILVVPAREAVVLGAVNQPGPVALRGGETLIDILPKMVNANSDIDRILVVRASDVKAQRETKEEYNLREYFEDGKADVVVPISDGDLVYVPTKDTSPGFFQNIGSLLGIIGLARSFVF